MQMRPKVTKEDPKKTKLSKEALHDHNEFIRACKDGNLTKEQFDLALRSGDDKMVMRLWKAFEASRRASKDDDEYPPRLPTPTPPLTPFKSRATASPTRRPSTPSLTISLGGRAGVTLLSSPISRPFISNWSPTPSRRMASSYLPIEGAKRGRRKT